MSVQDGSTQMVIDGLQLPMPERRWFEEWKAGGLSAVNVTTAFWENAQETVRHLSKWKRRVRENSDLVAIATSGREIEEIAASGRTAVILGFQNTSPFEHDIDHVEVFHDLGVRIAQLTYNLQNFIGCGYWETNDTGLSIFGKRVVSEMNRVGMLIDLSHCGDRTTLDAIHTSERPVAVTHANPREFINNPSYPTGRLTSLEAVKELASRGGIIGLTNNRHMMNPDPSLSDFVDLVKRTVDVAGIKSVAIGVDYGGGQPADYRTWLRFGRWSHEIAPSTGKGHEGWQDWFRGPQDFPNLRTGLLDGGFTPNDADLILGGNWLRFFSEAFEPLWSGQWPLEDDVSAIV